jgi:hypothetical protein
MCEEFVSDQQASIGECSKFTYSISTIIFDKDFVSKFENGIRFQECYKSS